MAARYYVLRCRACSPTREDDGFARNCSSGHEPALLVAALVALNVMWADGTDDKWIRG